MQNRRGYAELARRHEVRVTFPKNSVFLGSSLSALDSITVKAKAFTLVPTVIKYNHTRVSICCFQLTLICKNLSARHKSEVISCNVFLCVVSYNDFLVRRHIFHLWQIEEWENVVADTRRTYCLYSSPRIHSRDCTLNHGTLWVGMSSSPFGLNVI